MFQRSTNRPWLGLIVAGLLLAGLLPVGSAAAQGGGPSRITILPINTARLLVGQRFDLRVEVGDNLADNTDAAVISVTVNGRPAAQVFGKEAAKSNNTKNSAALLWRGLSFGAAGSYTVRAVAGSSAAEVTYEVLPVSPARAKNVILLIGDGMAWPMLTIARTVSRGLTQGKFNGKLEVDTMQAMGNVSTSGYDSLVTDSANSASAYATGQKGVVNSMGVYADETKDNFDDPRVENIIELAKRTRNMATGIVSTAELEDATPAAMVAHTRRRAEKQYIATQMFDDQAARPDVIIGGGTAYFLPKSTAGSKRTDERNLVDEFSKAGYATFGNRSEMKAAPDGKLLGLLHPDNMNTWIDREYTKDKAVLGPYTDQPTLMEMTSKAIAALTALPTGRQNGFFLMVEGASIDKQLHPMDWERAAGEMIEFDKSVGIAKAFAAQRNDTLIVVVADHGHSVSLYGTYDTTKGPGNPEAVGVYDQAKFPTFKNRGDGFPESWTPSRTLAVGFGNHPAYRDDFIFNPQPISPTVRDPNVTDKEVYIPNPKRDPEGILYASNLPGLEATEVHSADDVPLLASGPGAMYFNGYHDNTDLFFGMVGALGLDGTRNAARASATPSSGTLAFGLLAIGLTIVVGAGRYLGRGQGGASGALGFVAERLGRVRRALRSGVGAFRATLRDDDEA